MIRTPLIWMFALSMIIGFSSQAFAAEFTLNVGTIASKDTPWGQLLIEYKKSVEKESGDRIKVKLHFGGRKGDERAALDKVKLGNLQGFAGSTGAVALLVPEMAIFELPYLFKSLKEADKAIDKIIFPAMKPILEKAGFTPYIMSENGFRNFATKGVEIHNSDDLGKLKMRSQELWVHSEMYRALGGNPVVLPVTEVTTNLTSGNIDGFDNTALFAFATGWTKQIDTWNVSDHIYQPAIIIFNKDWFDGLPDDLQKIMLSNQKPLTKKGRKMVRKMNKALLKKIDEDERINVYRLTKEEKAVFANKAKEVHKMFGKKVGAKGQAILDKL